MNKERKKIIIIHDFTKGGGAERVAMNVFNSLNESIYDKTFLVLVEKKRLEDKNIIWLERKSTKNSFYQIVKVLRENKPDIVFTTIEQISLIISMIRQIYRFNFYHLIRLASMPSIPLPSLYEKVLRKLFPLFLKKKNF